MEGLLSTGPTPSSFTFTRNNRAGEKTKTVLESDNHGQQIGKIQIFIFDKKLLKYQPSGIAAELTNHIYLLRHRAFLVQF